MGIGCGDDAGDRHCKRRPRFFRPALLRLEDRLAPADLTIVPLWDGEAQGPLPQDVLMNRFGGNTVPGIAATVQRSTAVVHSGTGAMRIDTNGTIPSNDGYDYVITRFSGDYSTPGVYIDTRDLTRFQEIRFWVRNETGEKFTVALELKDYRQAIALYQAWGYEQTLGACQQGSATATGLIVRCPLTYQLLGSRELGFGHSGRG